MQKNKNTHETTSASDKSCEVLKVVPKVSNIFSCEEKDEVVDVESQLYTPKAEVSVPIDSTPKEEIVKFGVSTGKNTKTKAKRDPRNVRSGDSSVAKHGPGDALGSITYVPKPTSSNKASSYIPSVTPNTYSASAPTPDSSFPTAHSPADNLGKPLYPQKKTGPHVQMQSPEKLMWREKDQRGLKAVKKEEDCPVRANTLMSSEETGPSTQAPLSSHSLPQVKNHASKKFLGTNTSTTSNASYATNIKNASTDPNSLNPPKSSTVSEAPTVPSTTNSLPNHSLSQPLHGTEASASLDSERGENLGSISKTGNPSIPSKPFLRASKRGKSQTSSVPVASKTLPAHGGPLPTSSIPPGLSAQTPTIEATRSTYKHNPSNPPSASADESGEGKLEETSKELPASSPSVELDPRDASRSTIRERKTKAPADTRPTTHTPHSENSTSDPALKETVQSSDFSRRSVKVCSPSPPSTPKSDSEYRGDVNAYGVRLPPGLFHVSENKHSKSFLPKQRLPNPILHAPPTSYQSTKQSSTKIQRQEVGIEISKEVATERVSEVTSQANTNSLSIHPRPVSASAPQVTSSSTRPLEIVSLPKSGHSNQQSSRGDGSQRLQSGSLRPPHIPLSASQHIHLSGVQPSIGKAVVEVRRRETERGVLSGGVVAQHLGRVTIWRNVTNHPKAISSSPRVEEK